MDSADIRLCAVSRDRKVLQFITVLSKPVIGFEKATAAAGIRLIPGNLRVFHENAPEPSIEADTGIAVRFVAADDCVANLYLLCIVGAVPS